ncbi:MAG: TonB-dependent receptor [Bryobacteraceae bacterium]
MQIGRLAAAVATIAALGSPCGAQVMEAELRVHVSDPAGEVVAGASVHLASRTPGFSASALTDPEGVARLLRLPVGLYSITVRAGGFEEWSGAVEVRSAIPQKVDVKLVLGAVRSTVDVAATAPVLDPAQPLPMIEAGRGQMDLAAGTTLGRSTIDIVTTMPGWLLEANAVLHPRGSEYDTQYVVDGMPVYDNRSIGFAPPFDNGEFERVNVLTAGIPAEFGRRLGGVIALDTRRQGTPGQSTEAWYQRGSFGSVEGMVSQGYRARRWAASGRLHGGWTDRYFDPPSLDNFTNRASAGGVDTRLDRDVGAAGRLNLYFRSNRTNFLVPNDPEQQEAGQRQDRRSSESAGQVHYQHTFSSHAAGAVRAMVRDLSASLWSNPLATPVHVDQDRGFRESAIIGSATVEGEHHTVKFGGDWRGTWLHERFALAEPDDLPHLAIDFAQRRRGTMASAFVQDYVRWGHFAANIGFRADRYSLFDTESAVSPRLAVSYFVPKANLLLRAAYDRVFQPAPIENILLSSAAPSLDIEQIEGGLPVPASRGHFFEVGFRKALGNLLRFDATRYWRRFHNYSDDDVFFNTGIGFPIAFDRAEIEGSEFRLEMPRWRGVSGFASWSNMIGRARSPVTGGLFIEGGEAEELRDDVVSFPITQDQRNTFAGEIRLEPHRRVWTSAGIRYGSGLPFEAAGDDDDAESESDSGSDDSIPAGILERVNFERGRLRPNFSLNLSAGVRVMEAEGRLVSLQADVRNVTDRLNVINFSGLFSGAAIAAGRQVSFQLRARF